MSNRPNQDLTAESKEAFVPAYKMSVEGQELTEQDIDNIDAENYKPEPSEQALKSLAEDMHYAQSELYRLKNQPLFEYKGKIYGQIHDADETGLAIFNIVDGKNFHIPDYIRRNVDDQAIDFKYVGEGKVKVRAMVGRRPTAAEAAERYPWAGSDRDREKFIKEQSVREIVTFECDIDELESKLSDPASFNIEPRD